MYSHSTFVGVVAATFVVLWKIVRFFVPKSPVSFLPTPSTGKGWLWGHEKAVFMNEPGKAFRGWTEELGLVYRIKAAFGARDILVLSDPVSIAYILQKRIYDYHHSDVVRPRVARLLGKGLGWVEGAKEHRRMRSLVSPSLSSENIKAMSSDVRTSALQVIESLTTDVQGKQGQAATINILDWTSRATLNVIGRVAFLYDFEGGDNPEAQKILGGRRRGVTPAVRYAGFMTLMLLRRFTLLNRLPIPAIQSQGYAKMAVQSGVAHEMFRRSEGVLDDTDSKHQKDLLSRLLVAHSSGKISTEELYEQISTFIISGHETTTQTLGFTVWELSRHAEVQARLREEIKSFSGEPTYDDFQTKLPYLDAVLKETLRLYPGLPYMERVATKKDVIPLRDAVTLSNGQVVSEISVTPGQVVLIPIMAIHRMDSVWKDADEFRPERWLEDFPDEHKLCSGWAHTLAFSDGPRNCIGMRLAIFQYKVILSYLVERFMFGEVEAEISLKIASSLQAWVKGQEDRGPCLPVRMEIL